MERKAMKIEKLAVNRFEAAQLLSISLRTLDSLLARGELRGRRVGRRVLFPVEELQRFLKRDHPVPGCTGQE
jgi:excisionase family DNA binding protein